MPFFMVKSYCFHGIYLMHLLVKCIIKLHEYAMNIHWIFIVTSHTFHDYIHYIHFYAVFMGQVAFSCITYEICMIYLMQVSYVLSCSIQYSQHLETLMSMYIKAQ